MLNRNHRSPLGPTFAVLALLLFPAAASAVSDADPGPSAPAAVEPASAGAYPAAGGGGLNVPDAPRIKDVICLSGCSKLRTSSPGGTVEITGRNLESVVSVSFRTKSGRTRVRPDSGNSTRLVATVPDGAATGTVVLIGLGGSKSRPSAVTLRIGPVPKAQGRVRVTDASSSPARAYQYGRRKPTLRFIVAGGKASSNLRIDVVDRRGNVVRSFFREVPTGSPQKLVWPGRVRGGQPAPNGAYRFVVRNADGSAAALSKRLRRLRTRARSSAANRADDPFGFRLYRYIFPLKGSHTYGDGVGAGRGHQGVDILARCGLPIRAARAGTVYWNDYQAEGAGNYLVINTRGNGGKSQVYMHMSSRSKFRKGAKVKTGQVIGRVGSTGRSSACHLHFEQWSSPGWYQGGTFMNPLAALKRWDRYS